MGEGCWVTLILAVGNSVTHSCTHSYTRDLLFQDVATMRYAAANRTVLACYLALTLTSKTLKKTPQKNNLISI